MCLVWSDYPSGPGTTTSTRLGAQTERARSATGRRRPATAHTSGTRTGTRRERSDRESDLRPRRDLSTISFTLSHINRRRDFLGVRSRCVYPPSVRRIV